MPDSFELPRVRRAIVPLVSAGHAFVYKLIPNGFPSLPTVIGPLDNLPEPAAGLRGVQPIRICRRTLNVVDFPARKMRTIDFPLFALSIRSENKRSLARAD